MTAVAEVTYRGLLLLEVGAMIAATAIGIAVAVHALKGAALELRHLRDRNLNGPRVLWARRNRRAQMVRGIVQGAYLAFAVWLGALALRPAAGPTSPEAVLLVGILAGGSLLTVAGQLLDLRDYNRLLRLIEDSPTPPGTS